MKISRLLLLVIAGLMVVGCVAHYYSKPQPSIEAFTVPKINVESIAFLGEPIVLSGTGYYADGILLEGNGTCSFGLFDKVTINEGFYELIHTDQNNNIYFPEEKNMIIWHTAHGPLPGTHNLKVDKIGRAHV